MGSVAAAVVGSLICNNDSVVEDLVSGFNIPMYLNWNSSYCHHNHQTIAVIWK
jgi:hypothetical protein